MLHGQAKGIHLVTEKFYDKWCLLLLVGDRLPTFQHVKISTGNEENVDLEVNLMLYFRRPQYICKNETRG